MRISWLSIFKRNPNSAPARNWAGALCNSLLLNAGDDAGADGAAALADGEAQALVHRDPLDQLHRHRQVIGGASWRGRVWTYVRVSVVSGPVKQKTNKTKQHDIIK